MQPQQTPQPPQPSEQPRAAADDAAGAGTQELGSLKDEVDTVLRETLEKVRAAADRGGLKLPTAAEAATSSDPAEQALSPLHRDAVHVFSALCKLSARDTSAEQTDARKRLSLELVFGMLQRCGPVFRSSEVFIVVMKRILFTALVKNAVSSVPKVSVTSLQIFLRLTKNFNDHLKSEVGIFVEQVVLRILESGNSSYEHKYRSLQAFFKLCSDAPSAVELFLNFDCDVDEKNIFERIINCLSRIAQGKYTASEHVAIINPQQERDLRMLALQALVKLVSSVVEWTQRLMEDQPAVTPSKTEEAIEPPRSVGGIVAEPVHTDTDDEDGEMTDSTANASTTVPPAPGDNTVMAQKQRKRELQIGVGKFNMKPKRGIEHLKRYGFLSEDPVSMADFFKNVDIGVDKTALGDFLGENKPLNTSVLKALIDSLDFGSIELDAALRLFLTLFRLPGEAQKIDRMMEEFAQKYCRDNEGKFSNSDTAFVLAFSLIMLQTDLHNPNVKNKMSKEQFINANRGIDDGKNLPREYLENLYDSLVKNPISLQEDDDARAKLESQNAHGAAAKNELFAKEVQHIIQKSQELMERKALRQGKRPHMVARSMEQVRPFFEVICWPMLATLSILLEMYDEQANIELCMEGFRHCIRISARFGMGTERDAIVSSLAKFTHLTTLKEMKQKNIECIKVLLAIGLAEGNNLGPSWQSVLLCISHLDRLQLIKNRAREDFQFFTDQSEEGNSPAAAAKGKNGVPVADHVLKRRSYANGVSALVQVHSNDLQVELVNSQSVMAQIDAGQIDLLFNRSTNLEGEAIVHFVTQLVKVSQEELALVDWPRIFALQKLVEVADCNMSRPAAVRSRLWRALSQHFVEVASHGNVRICNYAIDSLRQLSLRFLEKDAASENCSPAEFLEPFEVVMTATPPVSREAKELIVSSIHNLVQGQMQGIKSGWKTVFRILHAAAQDHDNKAVPTCAFAVMQRVAEDAHNKLFAGGFFPDAVRTLQAFGQCKASKEISLQAIEYLLQGAAYLASRPDDVLSSKQDSDASAGAQKAMDEGAHDEQVAEWFVVLRALAVLVADPRGEVRAKALAGTFTCLHDHGSLVFNEEAWRIVIKGVVRPIFDDVLVQLQSGDDSFAPVVSAVVLKGLRSLREEHLARYMSDIFPLLCELVSVNSPEVRRGVRDILVTRISPLLTQVPAAALLGAAAASRNAAPSDAAGGLSPSGADGARVAQHHLGNKMDRGRG